jgi:hypothetical protein
VYPEQSYAQSPYISTIKVYSFIGCHAHEFFTTTSSTQ